MGSGPFGAAYLLAVAAAPATKLALEGRRREFWSVAAFHFLFSSCFSRSRSSIYAFVEKRTRFSLPMCVQFFPFSVLFRLFLVLFSAY